MQVRIRWSQIAIRQLDEALAYIETATAKGAEQIKKELLLKIDSLGKHPEQFAPDKYKLHNDGSFRAFEIHHYRVSYRFKEQEIRIIRIRYTKMNPLKY